MSVRSGRLWLADQPGEVTKGNTATVTRASTKATNRPFHGVMRENIAPTPTKRLQRSVNLSSWEERLITEHSGRQCFILIPLPPWSGYQILGGRLLDLTEQVISLNDIWGRKVDFLTEQLHEQTSWSERFSMIDRFLMEKFAQSQYEVRPEIYWAWQQLVSKGGRLSMREMAKTIGWSNRHFSKCFQQHIGITPKLAARQIRFYASLRRLRMSHEDSLSQIAIASGYADQSHFTREFHSFSGCSPKTYRNAHGAGLAGISGCLLNSSQ
ncbi:MAG: AraC family transcriptional regulator [Leptolyngbya sp. LCM1.Bin17]|nr:MAG: AraC family transcriptional regulator [Leptolyngbya sp. LCM1.Bin17]